MTYTQNFQNLLEVMVKYRDRLVAAVVHLNDTYLIDERPPRLPGYPRLIATVKALRQQLVRIGRSRPPPRGAQR
jgi:hypothetical protein